MSEFCGSFIKLKVNKRKIMLAYLINKPLIRTESKSPCKVAMEEDINKHSIRSCL